MGKVVITINKNGEAKTEVFGVVGGSCKNYTDAVRAKLGGEVVKEELKSSFYDVETEEKDELKLVF